MRGLTFTINPDARFRSRLTKPLSIRELLWLAQRSNTIPTLKFPATQDPAPVLAAACKKARLPAQRYDPNDLVCPSNSVVRAARTNYKKFLISTTLRGNGTWVANYGCTTGSGFKEKPNERAVAETIPYLAETLALADAQIAIDALIKDARRRKPAGRRAAFQRTRPTCEALN